jgi:radical SAM superfamily enzyme YgiQ (UPF0313 family)
MSNLGLHALYSLLNGHDDVVAERVFWQGERPLSLESGRPLADFAVLAFSISYELDYFHVAAMLRASGLPLWSTDRDQGHPLLIAGGPAITANPMPLAPFFDCLCIGEAEPILPGLLAVLSGAIGGKRSELRRRLTSLPGVYVPLAPPQAPVARRWAEDLDDFPVTSVMLTPDTELGDLYLIEVERGCTWNCRFCLVSTAFKPMRFRSVEKLMEQAERGLKYRKRLGLIGPAVFDHPHLETLLSGLRQMGAQFSLSSLRVSHLSDEAVAAIAAGGSRTVTIAPEAGSERLRQVIKKGICEDDILGSVDKLAAQGIKQLKLYFMIGLHSETEEDVEEIVKLTMASKALLDRQQRGARLSLNIAPFVPKASTPFQRLPMAPVSLLNQRLSMLKSRLSPKGIKVKSESPAWSQVQAVLARGDTDVAGVLASIEEVSLAGWRRAAEKYHLDADFYAHQRWDEGQKLPWAIIDSGTRAQL